jgi:hypothetical protein
LLLILAANPPPVLFWLTQQAAELANGDYEERECNVILIQTKEWRMIKAQWFAISV